jgi:hypothetical protein
MGAGVADDIVNHKSCTKCRVIKHIDEFGRCRRSKGGRLPLCRACKNAIMLLWRENNPEANRQQQARYRARNKQRCATADKRWRDNNREKAKDVAYRSRTKHKGRVNAITAFRYAQKRRATPPWLTKQHKLEMRETYETAATLSKFENARFHVDHIVPLINPIVCGLHVPWNLQILSAEENHKKGNKFEWG